MVFDYRRKNEWRFSIRDPNTSYELEVETFSSTTITFTNDSGLFMPERSIGDYRRRRDRGSFVDIYRTLKSLKKGFPEQIIEIGPGLSEVMSYLVNLQPVHLPIAIDPADYSLMIEMLNCALIFVDRGKSSRKIEKIIKRCELILNQEKVRFINEPLEVAIEAHPELVGSADIVIDIFGVIASGQRRGLRVPLPNGIELEKRLLKEDGVLVCSDYRWPPYDGPSSGIWNTLARYVKAMMNWF